MKLIGSKLDFACGMPPCPALVQEDRDYGRIPRFCYLCLLTKLLCVLVWVGWDAGSVLRMS